MEYNIKNLKEKGYEGDDACLETSLFEYGVIWKIENNKLKFIYGVGIDDDSFYNKFDCSSFDTDIDFWEEFDWAKAYDGSEKGLLSFVSLTLDEFDKQSLVQKICDLKSYYGFENAFGTSYSSFEVENNN